MVVGIPERVQRVVALISSPPPAEAVFFWALVCVLRTIAGGLSSRLGRKAMRSTDKPAQPALSTGTGTNRLSTYDAASHGLGTWKKKGFGNEAPDRTVQVMACLFSNGGNHGT